MKGIISIFVLPQEIEDLAATLERLKRNSTFIDDSIKYKVDITLSLSDELTDWENTIIPKDYFKDRATELCQKYLDWCLWDLNWGNPTILGCVSQRRFSLKQNPDADFFIWLDCDMFFKDTTLHYVASAYKMVVENTELRDIVVTPQFVKQWDNTWDIVTNKKYINEPVNYHLTADIYKEGLCELGKIDINQIYGFKFAGGWFTLISKSLLNKTGIPEEFGHYGLEDTYVMVCGMMMQEQQLPVSQFILDNLVVGEIRKARTNETIKKHIVSFDKKEEFKKIAESNWQSELIKFQNKLNANATNWKIKK
jgi:hypothetical protein